MEYVAFSIWCFLVALAGGLVGLVLGNIRLPATVLLAASPAAGAGANLAISAAAAGTASIAHVRAGRVNWRLFAWMAPPSVLGALAGGYVSGLLPRDALLLGIAAVLLYSGLDLLRWTPPARDRPQSAPEPEESYLNIRAAVISGALIGVLGGIVGLILGTLRMPALRRLDSRRPDRFKAHRSPVRARAGARGGGDPADRGSRDRAAGAGVASSRCQTSRRRPRSCSSA